MQPLGSHASAACRDCLVGWASFSLAIEPNMPIDEIQIVTYEYTFGKKGRIILKGNVFCTY